MSLRVSDDFVGGGGLFPPEKWPPTLTNLSYLLRHPELWPEGFRWDYLDCRRCGMGLAVQVWGMNFDDGYFFGAARMFGISRRRAIKLFATAPVHGGEMRPGDLACRIDRYVYNRKRFAWLRRLFRL